MKYLICLCILNYVVLSYGLNLNNTCFVKSGLKLGNVKNLLENGEPESQEEKCFLACFWKKIKVMNADNTINVDEIKKMFEPLKMVNDVYDSIMDVYQTCDTETKSQVVSVDECEAANIISKCVLPKMKKIKEEYIGEIPS